MSEIEITEPIIETISDQLPEVSTEQVAMVLAAWNTITGGDPLGTVRLDPATGSLAMRLSDNGVHKWRVTAPDGGTWFDMSPTLNGWNILSQPK